MRKFLGAFVMIAWLLAYVAVAAVVGDRVLHEPWWVQVIFFPVAGIGWVLPLKPLLKWMHARDEPKESPDV
jgi:membrane protein implicated in regulation of membrane protease activity